MNARLVSVTGASGFLGWHVAEAFQAEGWRVRGLSRPGSGKAVADRVERVEAGFDAASLVRAFEGSTVVVHGAAATRAANTNAFDVANVDTTRAVVAAANQVGARLLFISSQAAAGPGTLSRPAREDDEPSPVTPYGRSKLAAEVAVREGARVPWVILRPSSVYGPRDRGFLPLFRLAAKGLFLLASAPDASFTIAHVTDVARSIVLAADSERAVGQTIFVGHREPVTEAALLERLATAFGRTYRPFRTPGLVLGLAAGFGDLAWKLGHEPVIDRARLTEFRAAGFVCSVERAQETLGFRAKIGLDEGVAGTAAWYRESGWV